jgi:hypothetical protein
VCVVDWEADFESTADTVADVMCVIECETDFESTADTVAAVVCVVDWETDFEATGDLVPIWLAVGDVAGVVVCVPPDGVEAGDNEEVWDVVGKDVALLLPVWVGGWVPVCGDVRVPSRELDMVRTTVAVSDRTKVQLPVTVAMVWVSVFVGGSEGEREPDWV